MALTIEVSKVSVDEVMDKLWNITLNLRCLEGAVEVINQDFSVRYRPGQDAQARVQTILEKMQETIDDYKGEQQIFNAAQLDNAVTWLQTNLVG
jgi:hypothetical protein